MPVLVMPMALADAVEAALPLSVALAEALGAHLHLVHVLVPDPDAPGSPTAEARREQQARLRLDAMRLLYRHALPGRAPVAVTPVVLPPSSLAAGLAAYVRTVGASLVVAPAFGHSPQPGGRLAPHVVALAAALPCPMLVVPPGRSLAMLDRLFVSDAVRSGAGPPPESAGRAPRRLHASHIAAALRVRLDPASTPAGVTDLLWLGGADGPRVGGEAYGW